MLLFFIKRTIIFTGFFLGVLLLSIPFKTYMTWSFPNNPEYVQAVIDSREHPEDEELQKKVFRLRDEMYQMKHTTEQE